MPYNNIDKLKNSPKFPLYGTCIQYVYTQCTLYVTLLCICLFQPQVSLPTPPSASELSPIQPVSSVQSYSSEPVIQQDTPSKLLVVTIYVHCIFTYTKLNCTCTCTFTLYACNVHLYIQCTYSVHGTFVYVHVVHVHVHCIFILYFKH